MRKTEARILIIDDDEDVLFAARIYLKRFFTEVITFSSPKKILHVLNEQVIDVILLDMNYRTGIQDGKEGLYWFKEIQKFSPETVVVLMTAYSDVNVAVESIKKGAFDFVLKPWNNEKLLGTIHAAVQQNRALKKSSKLDTIQNNLQHQLGNVVLGKSQSFQDLINMVQKVSGTDANILLQGENGTGKYVIAKMIHDISDRKNEAFIHVDLGALSENLFESELFGYAKGAFTDAKESRFGRFELADNGTIFLDEIGNLPLNLQTKLLSVIQNKRITRLGESKERQIDVRIICATNLNLPKAVHEQKFRQDLFYRINTVELTIPPLRERKEDIGNLAFHFLDKCKKKYQKGKLQLSEEAIDALEAYQWPGNVRELEHLMERMVILCDGNEIKKSDLQFSTQKFTSERPKTLNLEAMEKKLVEEALRKHTGNVTKAAKELGITRAALYRRMEKFGL